MNLLDTLFCLSNCLSFWGEYSELIFKIGRCFPLIYSVFTFVYWRSKCHPTSLTLIRYNCLKSLCITNFRLVIMREWHQKKRYMVSLKKCRRITKDFYVGDHWSCPGEGITLKHNPPHVLGSLMFYSLCSVYKTMEVCENGQRTQCAG